MLDTQYRIKSVDGKELDQLVLILKHDPLHDTWFKINESTSSEETKLYLFTMEANILEQLLTDVRHNSALVPHSSGGQKVN